MLKNGKKKRGVGAHYYSLKKAARLDGKAARAGIKPVRKKTK